MLKKERKEKHPFSPSQEHRPAYDRDQEIARLRDELERPSQPKERVDIEERLMVCDVDSGFVEFRQFFFSDDSHSVEGRRGGLCPPVVDKVLRAPPLGVEKSDERRKEQHGDEERDRERESHRVKDEPLQVRYEGGEGRSGGCDGEVCCCCCVCCCGGW